jgi:transcriptional regulator with XRE-family HTH domain
MNKIKYFRKEKGLTVKALAEKANIAAGYLNNLENGKCNNPTYSAMKKISSALGQTVPDIFFPNGEA